MDGEWSEARDTPGFGDRLINTLNSSHMQFVDMWQLEAVELTDQASDAVFLADGGRAMLEVAGSWTVAGGRVTDWWRGGGARSMHIEIGGDLSVLNGAHLQFRAAISEVNNTILVHGDVLISGAGSRLGIAAQQAQFGVLTIEEGGTFAVFNSNNPANPEAGASVRGLASTGGTGSVIPRYNITAANPVQGYLEINGEDGTHDFALQIRGGHLSHDPDSTLALRKSGAGTQILSRDQGVAYSGGTLVTGGKLLVSNFSGSGIGTGPADVRDGGTLGGSGRIQLEDGNRLTIGNGGRLLGGMGGVHETLTIANDVTLAEGSMLALVLAAGGDTSSIVREEGEWIFADSQIVEFLDQGAAPGLYRNLISGLEVDPGVSGWMIANDGWKGVFTYNTGSVDLNLTATR